MEPARPASSSDADRAEFTASPEARAVADRVVGKKLLTIKDLGGFTYETLYKVETFRAFYPRRGLTGQGLVQFYGLRAVRRYKLGEKAPAWEVDEGDRLHTVDHGETRIK